MGRPNTPTYKTLNWPAYNKALRRRGSLTIWFDPEMAWAAQPTGKRGRQPVYTDAAVQTCLTMKVLFGMALRQTTGFVESLLCLIGLDWDVPDFSTEPPPEDAGCEHPASGGAGSAAPSDRQHRYQGYGRRRVVDPQARGLPAEAVGQGPFGH